MTELQVKRIKLVVAIILWSVGLFFLGGYLIWGDWRKSILPPAGSTGTKSEN
jgi:hypothetical protein